MVYPKCVFQKFILKKKSVDDKTKQRNVQSMQKVIEKYCKSILIHTQNEVGFLMHKGFENEGPVSICNIAFLSPSNPPITLLWLVCFIGINPNRKCVCQVSLVIFLRIVTCNVRWISKATKTQKCPNIIS